MKATLLRRLQSHTPATYPYPETAVPAGFPTPAQDYRQTQIDLNRILVKDPANTFFFRMYGDSMEGAGMHDRDEIIVDRSLTPETGKVVAAS